MAKKPRDTQSNRYQITINNPLDCGYTHEHIKATLIANFKTLEYYCLSDERGMKDGTLHTHIFICFTSRVRFSSIKRYFPEAHIERVKGTIKDNIDYVKKEGKWKDDPKADTRIAGTFEEYGKPPKEDGKRGDFKILYEMIESGMTNAEIIKENKDYIVHINTINQVRLTILTDKFKNKRRLNLKVIYISGATGTGKTRGVLDKYGDEHVYRVSDYNHPFDNYNCQPVIVFDEFRNSLKLSNMLDYCDIYSVDLPSRYANKMICFDTVYIISNWDLEKQYQFEQTDDIESWYAFLRRIHEVHIYNSNGTITKYSSVDDYFQREKPINENTPYKMRGKRIYPKEET